jgi:tetratricopeptide (TPR) repeat protein
VVLEHVFAGGHIIIGDIAAGASAAVHPIIGAAEVEPSFVGRDTELNHLLGLLGPAAGPTGASQPGPAAARVSVVAGGPGVGKTELARRAAELAVGAGLFPGGALFVDLHGYDPDPNDRVQPGQVFASLLLALDVSPADLPVTAAEQATTAHQLLARLGKNDKPVLLVLDNAADPDQIQPLLPAHPVHRVLVTSRDTLAAIPHAHHLDLDVLEPAAAVQLLSAAVAARRPNDHRIDQHRADAGELARLSGWLPLALQIIAALLAEEPDRPVADLVEELAAEQTRLDGIAYNARWSVRAAFDLSYRRLTSDLAELFALLPAIPGATISLETAAVAADQPVAVVRRRLMGLTRAHLLEQDDPKRWRMHDLIRLYASQHVAEEERSTAFTRVLAYYRCAADRAERRLTALPGHDVPVWFATPQDAMAWAMGERASLVAAVVLAAESHPDEGISLARDLGRILSMARALTDWVTVAAAAVQASEHVSDRVLTATAWENLGLALKSVRRFDEAITAHELARDLFREASDRHGEATALTNLGAALCEVRRFDEAATALEQARDIHRETGNRHGEAIAWNSLGSALHGDNTRGGMRGLERLAEALHAHEQARDLFRETGDRHGEATAWINLGSAMRAVGWSDKAVTAFEQARDLLQETGDRHGEALAWNNLGIALQEEVMRIDEAITAHDRALDLFRETGDRHGEATALASLGLALREKWRFEEGITVLEQARELFQATGDRHSEAVVWNNLGSALRDEQRFNDAINAYEWALDLFRETGDRHGEATALRGLGLTYQRLEQPVRAQHVWMRAVDLLVALGDHNSAGEIRRLLR